MYLRIHIYMHWNAFLNFAIMNDMVYYVPGNFGAEQIFPFQPRTHYTKIILHKKFAYFPHMLGIYQDKDREITQALHHISCKFSHSLIFRTFSTRSKDAIIPVTNESLTFKGLWNRFLSYVTFYSMFVSHQILCWFSHSFDSMKLRWTCQFTPDWKHFSANFESLGELLKYKLSYARFGDLT